MEGSNVDTYTLFTDIQLLEGNIATVKAKLEAYTRKKDDDLIIKTSNALDKLRKDKSKLTKEFEEKGGFDQIFSDSKNNFLLCVEGEDKEALIEFIEEYSDYADILKVIAEDAEEQRGKKQS